jgi:hypothetical protein
MALPTASVQALKYDVGPVPIVELALMLHMYWVVGSRPVKLYFVIDVGMRSGSTWLTDAVFEFVHFT